MNKVKVLVLDGNVVNEVYIDKLNPIKEIVNILGLEPNKMTPDSMESKSFGLGYKLFWQNDRIEKTSMEITTQFGLKYPFFIDSKVVIVYLDIFEGGLLDINLSDVKKHFNTKNAYWSLIKD